MKIGITGSPRWENKFKIKNSIFDLKNRFNSDLLIVTRGNIDGVDIIAKSVCMQLGIEYKEVLAMHQSWNNHCADIKLAYNKPYKVQNFFVQNKMFVEYCEYFLIYWNDADNVVSTQTDLLKKIIKSNKKHIVIK
jgi:hypothetical protein